MAAEFPTHFADRHPGTQLTAQEQRMNFSFMTASALGHDDKAGIYRGYRLRLGHFNGE
jgi:hypothetical protein